MTALFVEGGYLPFRVGDFEPLDASVSHEWENANVLWVHEEAKVLSGMKAAAKDKMRSS